VQILITGGTGTIGRRLIKRTSEQHHFTVLTRDQQKAASLLPDTVTLISKLSQIEDFGQFDAVINLAGEPIADKRWTDEQRKRICNSRWDITRELTSRFTSCNNPPRVFLSGSAIGYYGRQGQSIVTEDEHQVNEEFTHTVCRKWERLALDANKVTRVCVMRTGVVMAKGEGALGKMTLPFKLGLGGKMSDGEQFFSWIHVDDMVNGIVFLLEHDECEGPFNLTAPEPVTNKTFTHTLASVLHRPAIFTVPGVVLQLAMGDAADMLLTGQNVLPAKLTEAGFSFEYPQLRQALEQELG